jgi:hypothetical protein
MTGGSMKRLFLACGCLAAVACIRSDCDNVVLREAQSPDNRLVASVSERNCGATTPFVQVVSLRAEGSPFNGDDLDSVIFTMRGRAKVEVQWTADKELVIKRPEVKSDIFRETKNWKGVTVSYERSL